MAAWRHCKVWALLVAMACGGGGLPSASRQAMLAPAKALQHLQATEGLMASLTLVPPSVVTQNQLVEIRLGLRNTSPDPPSLVVQLYIDMIADSLSVMAQAQMLTLEPSATQLVSTFWAPVAFHGQHILIGIVQENGQRIAQLTWPLRILPPTAHSHGGYYAGVPYFTGAWLEPGALGFFLTQAITEEAIRRLVRSYHARGMDLLVIAYPEFGGCFYYPSMLDLAWQDYSNCVFNNRTYFYDCALPPKTMNPRAHGGDRCTFLPAFDIIGTIFDEAAQQGMQVMMGLGRSGDLSFALALEDYYLAARDGIPN